MLFASQANFDENEINIHINDKIVYQKCSWIQKRALAFNRMITFFEIIHVNKILIKLGFDQVL